MHILYIQQLELHIIFMALEVMKSVAAKLLSGPWCMKSWWTPNLSHRHIWVRYLADILS